ncbi:MAG: hypothetical protein ABFD92_12090 [Planctomycetaceae bacterium]|nr:hypothetical protein [Planctomycetaceae bacterium]
MKTALCLWGLLSAVMTGCASHNAMEPPVADMVRAGVVSEPRHVSQIEESLTDADIARRLDAKISAKLPASIALAPLKSHCSGFQPYLTPIDAAELNAWEAICPDRKIIHGIRPITPLVHHSERPTLHSLRQSAAAMGCELLLVYLQADSEVSNTTDAAILYCTIIGLWTVPGNVSEYKTVAQAVLLDCRTGAILGTATGDCLLKKEYPAAYEQQRRDELAKDASAGAMKDLQAACRRLMAQITQSSVAGR